MVGGMLLLELDTEMTRCEHTLRLDGPVVSLLSLQGKVWGVFCRKVGDGFKADKVVIWGTAERVAGSGEASQSCDVLQRRARLGQGRGD